MCWLHNNSRPNLSFISLFRPKNRMLTYEQLRGSIPAKQQEYSYGLYTDNGLVAVNAAPLSPNLVWSTAKTQETKLNETLYDCI